MHHDQYTPDAICRSMGLPSFVETDWPSLTLRVLLKPSFDPEVCITLSRADENTRLSVIALTTMLWQQPAPRLVESRREDVSMRPDVLHEALDGFESALAAAGQPHPVVLDGMSLAACRWTGAGSHRFECNAYAMQAVFDFAVLCVRSAWDACRDVGVRNALAHCGRYVGTDLPLEPNPPVPEPVRVSVLGTRDDKAEFFGLIQACSKDP